LSPIINSNFATEPKPIQQRTMAIYDVEIRPIISDYWKKILERVNGFREIVKKRKGGEKNVWVVSAAKCKKNWRTNGREEKGKMLWVGNTWILYFFFILIDCQFWVCGSTDHCGARSPPMNTELMVRR